MEFDHLVHQAIKGHTRRSPQSVVGILAYVDEVESLVLTHDELAGALQRLSDSRLILEIATHRFIENPDPTVPCPFSGYSYAEHEQVFQEYDKWCLQPRHASESVRFGPPVFGHQSLTIRWNLGEMPARKKHHEEAYIDDLAQSIDFLLHDQGLGQVESFELTPEFADIRVLARKKDTNMKDMHEVIEKAIAASHWPSYAQIVGV